ncbi:MAG: TIGR00153 family protein [Mesoaciditoga sp.]|uniref:TIGR00153 family protein n=1 Tax=Athalassotoga sp. TaxID=2022597 RepID=UPI000CC96B55|nr:MAG: TIGR00153 family protein [Mesoaciditoga sp.]PMP80037.1 MAG: TIGR00153 family protein [Mesoaciditoga sp.]HEU24837.1 TIGR00153 family protein [Mesoaciditoga lauensis]
MSLIFGKKENEVISLFKNHLDMVGQVIDETFKIIKLSCDEDCTDIVKNVRQKESEADSIRRNAETLMYSGAFLAQSRGDMLGLIEAVDKVANKAETVADVIYLQSLKIPDSLRDKYIKEYECSVESFKALATAVENLFEDVDKSKNAVLEVERWENTGDGIERSLIKEVFTLNIELARKIQLRELALQIGDIADRAEDASDRIEIIILKMSA